MNRVERLALGTSIFTILLYISWMICSYSIYQNQRTSDPLALVNISSPMLSLIIFSLLATSALLAYVRSDNKLLHVLLCLQLCIVTWLTPYFFSAFSRPFDTLWHLGISKKVLDIFGGAQFMGSDYFDSYPFSFIFNYITLSVLNLDQITYALYFFPVLISTVMVILWYSIIRRISDNKTAFISTILMIMVFYNITLHPSPRALGTILFLTSLFLGLLEGSHISFALLLLIYSLTLTHPLLPVLLLLFFFAFYIVRRFIAPDWIYARSLKINTFLVIFVAWLGWSFFKAMKMMELPISRVLYNIFTLSFVSTFDKVITPLRYIFPWFNYLRLLHLFSFGIIAMLFIISMLSRIYKSMFFKHNSAEKFLTKYPVETTFIIGSLLFFTFEVVFATVHGIRDRSLFFLLLTVSFLSALGVKNILEHESRLAKYARLVIVCWLAFLSLAYPLIAYNKEAFCSFPQSEDAGLKFITSNIEMNGTNVSMYRIKRLATYLEANVIVKPVSFPLVSGNPDIVIFLKSTYFEIAMGKELSFDNNSFTRFYKDLSKSYRFNKIYSNPTSEIFVKTIE